jgi:hypothetical protein
MRRRIRVRGKQQDIDLERLAHALLKAAREAQLKAQQPKVATTEVRDES